MKKKVLFRSLLGLLSGVALGQLIAIVISAIKGDGSFYAVIPELVNNYGGEQSAVIVQTIFLGVSGAIVGAASMIWEIDGWSLTNRPVRISACLLSPLPLLPMFCIGFPILSLA